MECCDDLVQNADDTDIPTFVSYLQMHCPAVAVLSQFTVLSSWHSSDSVGLHMSGLPLWPGFNIRV